MRVRKYPTKYGKLPFYMAGIGWRKESVAAYAQQARKQGFYARVVPTRKDPDIGAQRYAVFIHPMFKNEKNRSDIQKQKNAVTNFIWNDTFAGRADYSTYKRWPRSELVNLTEDETHPLYRDDRNYPTYEVNDEVKQLPVRVFNKMVDCRGMKCPYPVINARKALKEADEGEVITLVTTDWESWHDIPLFARRYGHELVSATQGKKGLEGQYTFKIRKGGDVRTYDYESARYDLWLDEIEQAMTTVDTDGDYSTWVELDRMRDTIKSAQQSQIDLPNEQIDDVMMEGLSDNAKQVVDWKSIITNKQNNPNDDLSDLISWSDNFQVTDDKGGFDFEAEFAKLMGE
tara:strand:- start:3256 stop:4287 length:1032 start_codon:yes stop_codon:yes gene_type:complete